LYSQPTVVKAHIFLRLLLSAGLLLFALQATAQDIFNTPNSSTLGTSILAPTDEFLPIDEAFKLTPRIDGQQLILNWWVAPDYYLYEERFKLRNDVGLQLTPRFGPGISKFDDFFEKDMVVFYNEANLTIGLPADASAFTLMVESQGCADAGLCYPPHTEAVYVDPVAQTVTKLSTEELAKNLALSVDTPTPTEKPLWLMHALVLAILGGMILNLMPCVFPVLSIKVMSLAQADRDRLPLHGWVYTAGIVICFLVFASILLLARKGGEAIGWGFQLQSPLLITALIYLFFVMGLSLSGMVQIGARWMGAGQNLTQKSGLKGSFFTGVLAAVVASPCTAPFMGAALGFALTQPGAVGLSIFAALGFGMALPLLLLCYIPALAQRLPRPGPWMETFKEILAFPLYLTAIWLLWVLGRQAGVDTLIVVCSGALAIAFSFWLINRPAKGFWQIIKYLLIRAAWLVALIMPWQALNKTTEVSRWQAYSAERLEDLRSEGKPVFVNMTADWCLTCLANERLTLGTDEVEAAFDSYGVATLKGDWTNRDPKITQLLEEYGRSGVPLYLWFPAGHKGKGQILPQLLTRTLVIDALKRDAAK
jgi:thiol:disulfide interchange protein DsbD